MDPPALVVRKRGDVVKISLRMGDFESDAAAEARALEQIILRAGEGDFEAREALVQQFLPLLQSLARRRASDVAEVNRLIETGKEALLAAARRYKAGRGTEKFKLQAAEAIDAAMANRPRKGWLARLFKQR